MRGFRRFNWVLVPALLGASACGPKPEAGAPVEAAPRARPTRPALPPNERDAAATLIARLAPGTFGPRRSVHPQGHLVVWATPRGEQAGWYSLVMPTDRSPREATRFAEVGEGLRSIHSAPLGRERSLVTAVRRVGHRELIEGYELDARGHLVQGPQVLVETQADILWVETRPTPSGALVFWAEATQNAAEISVATWEGGKASSSPQVLVRNASAWQLAQLGDSWFIASLEGPETGRLIRVRRYSGQLELQGQPLTLAQGVQGGFDLDMVATSDQVVVIWGEQQKWETRLRSAVLSPTAEVRQPARYLTLPRGEQSLVQLAGHPELPEAWVVWEEPAHRTETGRVLYLAQTRRDREPLSPDAQFFMQEEDPLLPLVKWTPEGLTVVTTATRCPAGRDCSQAPVGRLFATLPPDDSAVQVGAIELPLQTRQPARMVWDLSCPQGACSVLAARGESHAATFAVRLQAQPELLSPLSRQRELPFPRVKTQEILEPVPDLVALPGWKHGGRTWLSWLSYFDDNLPYETPDRPAPDGRKAPVRALLATREVVADPEQGAQVKQEQVISYRARSWGGLSFAPSPQGKGGGLLAWAALDQNQPQLFLTSLDNQGKKQRQKMLTRTPGEITEIAALPLKQGYVVAWVDGRDADAEIYAARVNENLEIVGKEQKLTEGAIEPTGLSLVRLQNRILLTWADTRGSSRPGYSDLHWLSLDADSLESAHPLRRLLATEAHSHSPQTVPLNEIYGTALLGWLEAEQDGAGRGTSQLLLAEVDGAGRLIAPPTEIPLPDQVRSFTMACEGERCQVIATLDRGERGELWGLIWQTREEPRVAPLVVLEGPSSQVVAPRLLGDELYYVDQSRSGQNYLRRLSLEF